MITDMIDRARAKLTEHATTATEADRYQTMSNRDVLRRFIIWCHELGDYDLHQCIKTLFNLGYRGRELDLSYARRTTD